MFKVMGLNSALEMTPEGKKELIKPKPNAIYLFQNCWVEMV